jgi:hypothetical protein
MSEQHVHTDLPAQPLPETQVAETATSTEAKDGKDGAKILMADGTPRIDYIRKRWREGASRGDIVKEVNELKVPGTKEVPYQIVFSATKDVAGGPTKPPSGQNGAEEHAQT